MFDHRPQLRNEWIEYQEIPLADLGEREQVDYEWRGQLGLEPTITLKCTPAAKLRSSKGRKSSELGKHQQRSSERGEATWI